MQLVYVAQATEEPETFKHNLKLKTRRVCNKFARQTENVLVQKNSKQTAQNSTFACNLERVLVLTRFGVILPN